MSNNVIHEQIKKPDSGRAILLAAGFACVGVFIFGLDKVVTASESGNTIKLVLGVLGMVFGGMGAVCVGRPVFTKRP
jgi:hypothetical protein